MKNSEKVFFCDNHENGVAKTGVQEKCPECGDDMKEIGWFEFASDASKDE